ncbi:unnamed protein product [Ectocarpus sp. 4 AP-2014]
MPATGQQSEDNAVRHKVNPKDISIEADLDELSAVVTYVVETTYLDAFGVAVDSEKKRERKRIKLRKNLKPSTDVSKLAGDVMKKCKYVHASKRDELERVIQELQHQLIRDDLRASTGGGGDGGDWWRGDEEGRGGKNRGEEEQEEAQMDSLEDYVELLYEGKDKDDMTKKIKGTALILDLCCHVGNLEHLIQDHTLMGALTRVLSEEYKKSVELCYNILRAFLAFSNFMEMHPILSTYRVGNITLKIVELEVQRAQHRQEEKRKRSAEVEKALREARGNDAQTATVRRRAEREEAKQKVQTKRQDKLLFVGLHILINLAEEVSTERKMVRKGLVELLKSLLERASVNLLYLTATFLKKLSVLEENKDRAKECGVAGCLVRFVPCSCDPLIVMTLRLLYNLSFDPDIRAQMVKAGLIPKLVELLKRPPYRARGLRLLYHMSIDDRCKAMFAYTDAMPIVMQLVLNFPQKILAKELAALAVNLSLNPRNAQMMASQRGLPHLVERVTETKDPLLMKVVRNISMWTFRSQEAMDSPEKEYRERTLWDPLVEPLLDLATETESHEMLVEVLGTLNNLTALDLPKGIGWVDVLSNYALAPFLTKLLVPGMAQNDIILEVVILAGVMAQDPQAAALLAGSRLISALHDLWSDKSGDTEITLQLLLTLWWLLHTKESREEVLYSTGALTEMLDALDSRHPPTRAMATACMDIVLEFDRSDDGRLGQMGEQVRRRRFAAHNREWLHAASQIEDIDVVYGSRARNNGVPLSDSEDHDHHHRDHDPEEGPARRRSSGRGGSSGGNDPAGNGDDLSWSNGWES